MSGRRTPRRSTRSPPASAAKPASTSFTSAGKAMGKDRPALPLSDANPLLKGHKGRLHSVKTQELKLQDNITITIARVKAPTPEGVSGHLIKRFDTDAVSASSFFRVAFPSSSQAAEEAEMAYLRSVHDAVAAGAEHPGSEARLTGTWSATLSFPGTLAPLTLAVCRIPTADAADVARDYGIFKYASSLIAYENPYAPPNQDVPEPEAPVVATDPSDGVVTRSAKKVTSPTPSEGARSSKRARVTSPRLAALSGSGGMAPSPSILSLAPQAQSASGDVDASAVMVTVTSVSSDPTTGAPVEETTTASLMGTDEQVAAARDEARVLVASLKEAAAASDAAPSTSGSKKRALDGEAGEDAKGMLNRLWWRRRQAKQGASNSAPLQQRSLVVKAPSDRVDTATRRNIAMVGLVVAGAAACVPNCHSPASLVRADQIAFAARSCRTFSDLGVSACNK